MCKLEIRMDEAKELMLDRQEWKIFIGKGVCVGSGNLVFTSLWNVSLEQGCEGKQRVLWARKGVCELFVLGIPTVK